MRLSVEDEVKLGEMIMEMYLSDKRLVQNPTLDSALSDVVERLNEGLLESEYRFTYYVVAFDEVNAMTFPGANIVVNSGLIEFSESPEELAAVMAHELGHAQLRHVVDRFTAQIGVSVLLSILTGGDASLVHEIISMLVSSAFSRSQEAEADLFGMELLEKVHIDPKSMGVFFERLNAEELSYDQRLELIMSHPHNNARIEVNEAYRVKDDFSSQPLPIDWKRVKSSLNYCMVIESFSNPKYKYLLSLSKSKTRKKEGVFLMEGKVENELAFRTGHIPKIVVFSEAYTSQEGIQHLYGNTQTQFIQLSKALFDALSYQHVPGNYICVFTSFEYTLEALESDGPFVVLEKIEKPGNLGAILRTCDALGVKNIIATQSPVDLFNPNILRNSRGAVFTTKCVFTSNEDAFSYLKQGGREIYSAALNESSVDYRSTQTKPDAAFVFGSEAFGLSDYWLSHSDQKIIIPMLGVVDSLNVSVSVAIVISHHMNRNIKV